MGKSYKPLSKEDEKKFNEWLEIILTFDHLSPPEIGWYINALARRFRFPRETLVKLFKKEGLLGGGDNVGQR